jgi:hypothetical protein
MKLHYDTVKPLLNEALIKLMQLPELESFRLVGGTALSLQKGHRLSVDIDMFTDALYGSLDFEMLQWAIEKNVGRLESSLPGPFGIGKCFDLIVGDEEVIKLDLFYTDPYVFDLVVVDGIRMASSAEIAAMKLDVIQRNGRKKDFWDIHVLLEQFTISEMLDVHERRYPYTHDRTLIINNLLTPDSAEDDIDPVCQRGYAWSLIKLDIIESVRNAI